MIMKFTKKRDFSTYISTKIYPQFLIKITSPLLERYNKIYKTKIQQSLLLQQTLYFRNWNRKDARTIIFHELMGSLELRPFLRTPLMPYSFWVVYKWISLGNQTNRKIALSALKQLHNPVRGGRGGARALCNFCRHEHFARVGVSSLWCLSRYVWSARCA